MSMTNGRADMTGGVVRWVEAIPGGLALLVQGHTKDHNEHQWVVRPVAWDLCPVKPGDSVWWQMGILSWDAGLDGVGSGPMLVRTYQGYHYPYGRPQDRVSPWPCQDFPSVEDMQEHWREAEEMDASRAVVAAQRAVNDAFGEG